MTRHKSIVTLAIVVLLTATSIAIAQTAPTDQTGQVFVNISGGGQSAERTLTTSQTFPLYAQTASFGTVQTVGSGGLFDISAGDRFRPQIAALFGISTLANNSTIEGTASIPHPLFFNQFATVPFTRDGKHSEESYYFQAIYFLPYKDKIDFAFGIGPTFIHARQDVVSALNVPSGTQNVEPLVESRRGTATGIIISVDGTYMFEPRFGAGAFMRYNGGGSIDIGSGQEMETGGFQFGIGLRVRLSTQ
jgi:hypothetical protein